MHVTFVGVGSEQLGISLLSAVLKREGHTTSLAFNPALFDYDGFFDAPKLARILDETDRMVDQVVADPPDLVAFSVLTASYQWSLRVATAIKERTGVPVIFGGVHPSAVPELCLENECVDYVCVGEGEEALVRLCEVLPESGARPVDPIPNLWWRDGDRLVQGESAPFLADLDSLPAWDKELWRGHVRIQDNWMTMSSRGCPYRCTFCFNNFFAKLPGKGGGRYLRQRSIDHMMDELIDAKATWKPRRIDFQDDIFTTHKDWIRDFTREYRREIDLPFQCLVHPRFVDDDIARWLKDAGCQHVQMGVQSVDEEYKRTQLLRMESDSHLRSALASLEKADLDLKLDHILGLPGEPITAQELAADLYREFPPRRIQTFWLVHLPGVELTTGAVARGELTQADLDAINRGDVRRYHAPSDDSGADGEHAALYRRYELLFRLMTVVPKRVARRLRIEHIPVLPPAVNQVAGISCEVLNAAINRDEETGNYVRYYAHHLPRQLARALADKVRGRRRDRVRIATPNTRPELRPSAGGSPRARLTPQAPPAVARPSSPPDAVPVQLTSPRR